MFLSDLAGQIKLFKTNKVLLLGYMEFNIIFEVLFFGLSIKLFHLIGCAELQLLNQDGGINEKRMIPVLTQSA